MAKEIQGGRRKRLDMRARLPLSFSFVPAGFFFTLDILIMINFKVTRSCFEDDY